MEEEEHSKRAILFLKSVDRINNIGEVFEERTTKNYLAMIRFVENRACYFTVYSHYIIYPRLITVLAEEQISRQYACLSKIASSMNKEPILEKKTSKIRQGETRRNWWPVTVQIRVLFHFRVVKCENQTNCQSRGQSTRTVEENSKNHVRRSS